MVNKTLATCREAVASVFDGATILLGSFAETGLPGQLLEALREQGAKNLSIVHNGSGAGTHSLGGLIADGRVRKLTASFPNNPGGTSFQELYLKGQIELELVPQGTLAERIRAAGAGLGGFFTPTAAGTELAAGKETRIIDGRNYVFVRAYRGDRLGNLNYRMAMRNFNMPMATAAKFVVAEIDQLVPAGAISPEDVHTPGIFVDHVVEVARHPELSKITTVRR
jgi:3-oxoadipate CoA-transferase alpha subunit